ncbi:DoxX family membrane protein [Pedobacter sp.]|uniref:DoxX family membrane protein n=1 Tax=Pedobacter sp. TaxID=1411316 RepID=UPI00396CA40C
MKIVKFILCLLFGLTFINAGLNKFFNYMPTPQLTETQQKFFEAFMQITWLMPLVATIEILGGLLFIIPKTRALGAIVILPVMVGILIHHSVIDPSGLAMALVLFVINLWIIIDNYRKYRVLIS